MTFKGFSCNFVNFLNRKLIVTGKLQIKGVFIALRDNNSTGREIVKTVGGCNAYSKLFSGAISEPK